MNDELFKKAERSALQAVVPVRLVHCPARLAITTGEDGGLLTITFRGEDYEKVRDFFVALGNGLADRAKADLDYFDEHGSV